MQCFEKRKSENIKEGRKIYDKYDKYDFTLFKYPIMFMNSLWKSINFL